MLKAEGVPVVHTMHEYRQISPNYTLVTPRPDRRGLLRRKRLARGHLDGSTAGHLSRSALAVAEWYSPA